MPGMDEETPLLRQEGERASFLKHHRIRLSQSVSKKWADAVLLLLTFDTGLVDGSAISTWNSFVSMQTGKYIPYLHIHHWYIPRTP